MEEMVILSSEVVAQGLGVGLPSYGRLPTALT